MPHCTKHSNQFQDRKLEDNHHSQTESQLTNNLFHTLSLQGAPSQGNQDKEVAMDSLVLSRFPVYNLYNLIAARLLCMWNFIEYHYLLVSSNAIRQRAKSHFSGSHSLHSCQAN